MAAFFRRDRHMKNQMPPATIAATGIPTPSPTPRPTPVLLEPPLSLLSPVGVDVGVVEAVDIDVALDVADVDVVVLSCERGICASTVGSDCPSTNVLDALLQHA